MIPKIQVEFSTKLKEKIATGPLKTVVYTGSYGQNVSNVWRCRNDNDETGCKKDLVKTVIVKKIELRIVRDNIEWNILQTLNHPNVARYILVEERKKLFQPDAMYIVQNHYTDYTLPVFIEQTCPTICDESSSVLKTATRHMVAGLKYLHDRGNVHGNLKPSNVLVLAPISKPKGFVLTDYAYTDHRNYPQKHKLNCPCFSPGTVSDLEEITEWMAPELINETPDEVIGNKTTSTDDNHLDLSENGPQMQDVPNTTITFQYPSAMIDVFSLGKILGSMFEKVTALEKVDEILCQLLVKQMTFLDPSNRISCDDILKRHPLLAVESKYTGIAELRIMMIKKLFDKIKDDDVRIKQLEEDVKPVTKKFFPWKEPIFSFRDEGISNTGINFRYTNSTYDCESFVELLRLIKNSQEHLEKLSELEDDQKSRDGFSEKFPFVLPLTYICIERSKTSTPLIHFLTEIYNKIVDSR